MCTECNSALAGAWFRQAQPPLFALLVASCVLVISTGSTTVIRFVGGKLRVSIETQKGRENLSPFSQQCSIG